MPDTKTSQLELILASGVGETDRLYISHFSGGAWISRAIETTEARKLILNNDSVSDEAIGERIINDSEENPTSSSTGKISKLFSWLAGRLKAITGESSWLTAPTISLKEAAPKINPIFPSGYQVGDDPFSSDDLLIGQNFQLVGGSFYQNYKVFDGGYVYLRCGAGVEPGYSRVFMAVEAATGVISIPGDVHGGSLFFSAGGLVIESTTPNELGSGYGFIRHASGPLLFFIGTESSFYFKNGDGGTGNLISINQDGTITYQQTIPTGTGTACVFSGGTIIALSSSRKVKENIRPLEVREDILDLINPVTFNYKKQDPISNITHGFIVEDIEEVEPSLVTYEKGKAYSIQPQEMIAVLWREVRKLKLEIGKLNDGLNSTSKQ